MKKALCFVLFLAMCFTLPACSLINNDSSELETTGSAPESTMGLVTDHASFESEMSKYISLDNYSVTIEESFSTNYVTQNRTYTHKEDIKLKEQHSPFTITIDGIAFQMPATVGTFLDKGFQVTHINDQYVSGGVDTNKTFSSGSLTLKTPTGKILGIYVIAADLGAPTKMKDCLVIQLCPDLYEGERYYPDSINPQMPELVYFNGITNVATLEDILSNLGEPQKITHSFSKNNAQSNLIHLQLAYYFENAEYSGSMYFTIDIFRLPDGSKANMAHDISYYINPPKE